MADLHPPVQVACAFEGPAERLFEAWLDPAIARLWLFKSPQDENIRAEIDARQDGGFVLTHRRGGYDVEHTGRYLLIERPHRIAFTLEVPGWWSMATKVSVTIGQMGGRLILSLAHEGIPPKMAAGTEEGWSRSLDRLAVLLERMRAEEAGGVPDAVA